MMLEEAYIKILEVGIRTQILDCHRIELVMLEEGLTGGHINAIFLVVVFHQGDPYYSGGLDTSNHGSIGQVVLQLKYEILTAYILYLYFCLEDTFHLLQEVEPSFSDWLGMKFVCVASQHGYIVGCYEPTTQVILVAHLNVISIHPDRGVYFDLMFAVN